MLIGSYKGKGDRKNIIFSEMYIKDDEGEPLRLNPNLGTSPPHHHHIMKLSRNGQNLTVKVDGVDSHRSGNRTNIVEPLVSKPTSETQMQRPKRFEVRKRLQFCNGVFMPTTTQEKEAINAEELQFRETASQKCGVN